MVQFKPFPCSEELSLFVKNPNKRLIQVLGAKVLPDDGSWDDDSLVNARDIYFLIPNVQYQCLRQRGSEGSKHTLDVQIQILKLKLLKDHTHQTFDLSPVENVWHDKHAVVSVKVDRQNIELIDQSVVN